MSRTKRRIAFVTPLVFAALAALFFLLVPQEPLTAEATVSKRGPKTPAWGAPLAKPISVKRARAYFQRQTGYTRVLASDDTTGASGVNDGSIEGVVQGMVGATPITPEVEALARGLDYDAYAIFDYVHNHIKHIPIYGLRKGPTLTLLDEEGTDFDQASLLVALLRASNFEASYIEGDMAISTKQMASWLGVDANKVIIADVLDRGGIPYDLVGGAFIVSRAWVWADIDGEQVQLDAAFKQHEVYAGIDVLPLLDYDRDAFIAEVISGATITPDYVQNLNYSGLDAKLTEYATNLHAALLAEYPNADIDEIIGGKSIVRTELESLSAGVQFAATAAQIWDEIPVAYSDTFRVQFKSIDETFLPHQIGGKRLTLSFEPNELRPQIRVGGELIAEGEPSEAGAGDTLTMSADHPFAAFDGTYADQVADSYAIAKAKNIYSVVYATSISARTIERAHRTLTQLRDTGAGDSSESVGGQALTIIGLNYARQDEMVDRVGVQLNNEIMLRHHAFGVVRQTEGVVIDWVGIRRTTSARSVETSPFDYASTGIATYALGSALEHTVIEQMYGSDEPGLSTVKAIWLQNEQGGRTYWMHAGNAETIAPELAQTYSTYKVDQFKNDALNGAIFLIPANGQISLNAWTGSGYLVITPQDNDDIQTSGGYLISGDLNGGHASVPKPPDCDAIEKMSPQDPLVKPGCPAQPTQPNDESQDPVDLATGFFLVDRANIGFGGKLPMGLTFSQSYNSGLHHVRGPLGYGWSMTEDIRLTRTSRGFPALGARTPRDAVAYMAYFAVVADVAQEFVACPYAECDTYNEDALGRSISMLAAKWMGDQLVDNTVIFKSGTGRFEFIELPDGTYSPPPGMTSELNEQGDGTFQIIERDGSRLVFDGQDRLAQVIDIHGNQAQFSYDGDRLVEMRDAYNRTISLDYDGDLVTQVTSSTGQTVSFSYEDGDLVQVVDPGGSSWQYVYDEDHHMMAMVDALGVTTVTNEYDALHRVVSQAMPRQSGSATYQFFFTRHRTMEQDPDGHRTTTVYDDRGRRVVHEDALGRRVEARYDGQNHVEEASDGNGLAYEDLYDGDHNLITTTNPLGQSKTFAYNENGQVVSETNPLGDTRTHTYDPKHQLTSSTHATGATTIFKYDELGRAVEITSPKGVAMKMTYDIFGNVSVTQIGEHPAIETISDGAGRRLSLRDEAGAETTFSYNANNQLVQMTDPLGNGTSFVYDATGRLLEETSRNGETTSFTYTPTGKFATIAYDDGSVMAHTYDVHDRVVTTTDASGETHYAYDAIHRITSIIDVNGFEMGYEYDDKGNLVAHHYPGDKTVRYSYDKAQRLTGIHTWLGQTATFVYDSAGRLVEQTHFNGGTTAYTFNDNGQVISQIAHTASGELVSSLDYVLGPEDRRILSDEVTPLHAGVSGGATEYTYNDANNRLLSDGATTWSYDEEGRAISNGLGRTLTFDVRGRLTAISGDLDLEFHYDARNKRVRRIENGIETLTIDDGGGNVIATADASGTITRYYIHGLGLQAAITPSGEVFDYHFDGSANTIAISDGEGRIVSRYAYLPYGKLANAVERFEQPFRFAGRMGVMAETDAIHFMRNRYYDADIRRFLSEDPIGLDSGTANLFGYATGNPISFCDPSGLMTDAVTIFGSFFGLLAGGVSLGSDDEGNVFLQTTSQTGAIAMIEAEVGLTKTTAGTYKDLEGPDFAVGIQGTIEVASIIVTHSRVTNITYSNVAVGVSLGLPVSPVLALTHTTTIFAFNAGEVYQDAVQTAESTINTVSGALSSAWSWATGGSGK